MGTLHGIINCFNKAILQKFIFMRANERAMQAQQRITTYNGPYSNGSDEKGGRVLSKHTSRFSTTGK